MVNYTILNFTSELYYFRKILLIFLIVFFLFGCKTSNISGLNYVNSITSFHEKNPTRNPQLYSPYSNKSYNEINPEYILNPLDIIDITIVYHDTASNIQELHVAGTKLFGNVSSVRLSRGHPFFSSAHTSRIVTEITDSGNVMYIDEIIDFKEEELANWENIRNKLESIKSEGGELQVVAKLLPQIDCKLYPGIELQSGWSYRANYWADGAGLVYSPFETSWYQTSVTESGYIQLPIINNPSLVNDDENDSADDRMKKAILRASLTTAPSLLSVKKEIGYMKLSELIVVANKRLHEMYFNGSIPVKYPDISYLSINPINLSWWFSWDGMSAVEIPYENGALLIASVRKIYEQHYLHSLKKGANIYITVFPANPAEAAFCINIGNVRKDVVLLPGDRVVLSFYKP